MTLISGTSRLWMLTPLISICGFGQAPCGTIVNGSFETAAAPPNVTLEAPSMAINGWEVTPVHVDWIHFVDNVVARDGIAFLDLSGSAAAGGVKQAVCTIPDERYMLSFHLNVNPQGGSGNAENILVLIGSQSFIFTANPDGTTSPEWTRQRITFGATSATTLIEFRSLGSDNTGPLLDNVRLRRLRRIGRAGDSSIPNQNSRKTSSVARRSESGRVSSAQQRTRLS